MNPYQETHETWDKIAQLYEETFMDLDLYNDTYQQFCDAIPKIDASILEIGCGPGNLTQHLLQYRPKYQVTGIDISENMLLLARKNNPKASFIQLDCRNIKNLNNTYNGIIIGFCLPYLAKQDGINLIQDCSNLLHKNGILYISFVEASTYHFKYNTAQDGKGMYFHYYNLTALKKVFVKNHFNITQTIHKKYKTEIHTILIAKKR